jgi:hypothetical protein
MATEKCLGSCRCCAPRAARRSPRSAWCRKTFALPLSIPQRELRPTNLASPWYFSVMSAAARCQDAGCGLSGLATEALRRARRQRYHRDLGNRFLRRCITDAEGRERCGIRGQATPGAQPDRTHPCKQLLRSTLTQSVPCSPCLRARPRRWRRWLPATGPGRHQGARARSVIPRVSARLGMSRLDLARAAAAFPPVQNEQAVRTRSRRVGMDPAASFRTPSPILDIFRVSNDSQRCAAAHALQQLLLCDEAVPRGVATSGQQRLLAKLIAFSRAFAHSDIREYFASDRPRAQGYQGHPRA